MHVVIINHFLNIRIFSNVIQFLHKPKLKQNTNQDHITNAHLKLSRITNASYKLFYENFIYSNKLFAELKEEVITI